MKITAETIDHNVTELIGSLLLWETADCPDTQKMCCGYVQGLIDLAKNLKEVLRA